MSLDNLPSYVDVRLKASHIDFVNKNAVRYTEKGAKKGAKSWVYPYGKPQLVGHNKLSDPIGRIIDARIVTLDGQDSKEPPKYLQLIARITDPDAIQKIIDGRYNTVSVGSRTARVICSECGTVITEDGLCEHKKGSFNEKGEMIHWIIDQIEYIEDSFVNEPADEWAGIDAINIGAGWITYHEFVDNRVSLLAELKLEDTSMPQAIAKLTAEQRNKLSEVHFCGPGRSFPAHDEAHVIAGLSLLKDSKFSEETVAKIRASLYRKGKRLGIVPSQDELAANPELLTARLEDNWTEEETTTVVDFFKENPDADLPESKEDTNKQDDNLESKEETVDIQKMKVADLKDLVIKLQKDIDDSTEANKEAIALRDKKITTLETKLQESETVALQKDDEISNYLDEVALLEKKLRDAVISNVIDLVMTDNTNEDINGLHEKYSKRQTESLIDTLSDLRNNMDHNKEKINSDEKVVDTTLAAENSTENSDSNDDESQNTNTMSDGKYSIFDRDRSSTTEDK